MNGLLTPRSAGSWVAVDEFILDHRNCGFQAFGEVKNRRRTGRVDNGLPSCTRARASSKGWTVQEFCCRGTHAAQKIGDGDSVATCNRFGDSGAPQALNSLGD
jgi:hypothetical protein